MKQYAIQRVACIEGYTANPNIYPIKLDANECAYPVSDQLKRKLCDAIMADPLTIYPDPMAEEVCAAYARLIGVNPENLAAGDGSDEILNILCSCFLDAGDKVLYFTPDFSMYGFYAEVKGNQVITVPKGADLALSADLILEAYHTYHPKMILFSNPCNPTGSILPREQVLQVLRETDCIVVVDEAYMDFCDQSVLDEVDNFDNLIVLKTCSKAYALAAIRLGFAVANPEIIQVIRKVKSPYNVSVLTQLAGRVLLEDGSYVKENVRKIAATRQWFYETMCALANDCNVLKVYPSGANFILMESPKWKEIDGACKQNGIIIRTYGNGQFRISMGTDEQMQLVADIIRQVLTGQEGDA